MRDRFRKSILAALIAAALLASAAMAGPEAAVEPMEEPAAETTAEPAAETTAEPTAEPTEEPTEEPTAEPTVEPTEEPAVEPTEEPAAEPTVEPTEEPAAEPTAEPTEAEPVSLDEPEGADVPMLTAYGITKGSGTADDPYQIENADQMNKLRQTGSGAGVYFKLMKDINLNADSPFGEGPTEQALAFNGTLDGNNYTITYSLTLDGPAQLGYMGLFWRIGDSGTVKNVKIAAESTITLTGEGSTFGEGGIAAENDGLIENCTSSIKFILGYADTNGFDVASGASQYLGGIAGRNKGTIRGCTSACSLEIQDVPEQYRGGSHNVTAPSAANVGGIAGLNEGRIENCTYTGSLIGTSAVGGIAGSNGGGSSDSVGVITGCTNTGAITESFVKDQYIGGIVGSNKKGSTVTGCHNKGTISRPAESSEELKDGRHCIGGIAGYSTQSTITRCDNTGKVDVPEAHDVSVIPSVGGIAGLIDQRASITDCYNTAEINALSTAGGIVGKSENGAVENCYNSGSVWTKEFEKPGGGIVGENKSGTAVNCYYLDTNGGMAPGEIKTAEQFASGEVAWLLQAGREETVWGQKIESDGYPILTDAAEKRVYQVTFVTNENASYAVKYANHAGLAEMPADPTAEGHTFDHWAVGGADGEPFTKEDTVSGDMTVYAVEKERFGGESGEIERTVTYGTGLQINLSEYVKYRSGLSSEGKFTYTITSGNEGLNASVEGDTLTVPADAKAGEYTLAIQAKEKEPQYSLMSVDSFGTEPVDITIKLTVNKAASSGTAAGKTGLTYSGAAQALVEVTEAAVGGQLQYSTSEAGEYSPTVPTGTNAGDYTVWYKVVGDENHNDTAPKELTITIAKATPHCTVTMADYTCKADVKPEVTSDGADAAVTITYAKKGTEEFTPDRPTDAGEYTVKAVFAATENYNAVTATADFKITHQFNAGWEQRADGYYHLCACGVGLLLEAEKLTEVPAGLENVAGTVEELERLLEKQVDTGENYAVYDVKLEALIDGKWVEVTPESFPAEGVEVTLPYPEGTNGQYAFTVVHMFTTGYDGNEPGQTETLRTKNTAAGIQFTVKSLSPICVGWTAPRTPEANDTASGTAPDTGDDTVLPGWTLALCLCGAALTGLRLRRRRS